jgi:uncharacterized protein YjbJ (UPF0337 family)
MAGEMDQAKGRIKEAAGAVTGNEDLKNEGKLDQAAGKVKDGFEKVADDIKDEFEKVVDKIKG